MTKDTKLKFTKEKGTKLVDKDNQVIIDILLKAGWECKDLKKKGSK